MDTLTKEQEDFAANLAASTSYRLLAELFKRLSGGSIGFDLFTDKRSSTPPALARYITKCFKEEDISRALAKLPEEMRRVVESIKNRPTAEQLRKANPYLTEAEARALAEF